MNPMECRVRWVLLVAGLMLAATPAFGGNTPRCESTVAERLAEYGIGGGEVSGIYYVAKVVAPGRTGRRIRGVTAWVSLVSCEGSLVIDLNNSCRVKQAYTRGQCRLPGLKNF
jgi:hypothetical protein